VLDGEAVGGVDAVEEQAARPNAPAAAASTARRPSITTGYSAGGRLFAWTSTDRLAW